VLEYSSARARMSVIVRAPGGSIHLYCKGADAKVWPRVAVCSASLNVNASCSPCPP
jgi:phospholipid-translocating ATPase/phospholipid-transporting ATPase